VKSSQARNNPPFDDDVPNRERADQYRGTSV
jgi:hypothetical protein